jgi:hypothetical protein
MRRPPLHFPTGLSNSSRHRQGSKSTITVCQSSRRKRVVVLAQGLCLVLCSAPVCLVLYLYVWQRNTVAQYCYLIMACGRPGPTSGSFASSKLAWQRSGCLCVFFASRSTTHTTLWLGRVQFQNLVPRFGSGCYSVPAEHCSSFCFFI